MARTNQTKIGLLAILLSALGALSIAGPGVASLLETRSGAAALQNLSDDIYFARRTAADKKVPVTLCQSEDETSCANSGRWEAGWLMFEDYDRDAVRDPGEKIIRTQGPVADTATIRAQAGAGSRIFSSIAFTRLGLPKHASGMSLSGTLRVCGERARTTTVGLKFTSAGSTYATKRTAYDCV